MKTFKEAQERADQLRARLYGYKSKTFKAEVIDIFASPNHWAIAHDVYWYRLRNLGYPMLQADKYTVIVALAGHNLEVAGDLIVNDGLMELQPLIRDLPGMNGRREDINKKTGQE